MSSNEVEPPFDDQRSELCVESPDIGANSAEAVVDIKNVQIMKMTHFLVKANS